MGFIHRPLIGRLFTCLAYLFSLPLYWFSFLVPRSKNIWVYGAWFGYRYSDNSRHFFEYVCQHHPSIKSVWLSRDRSIVKRLRALGYCAYYINSWRGYWYTSRAAIVFSSNGVMDLNRPALSGAKKVMLYHGVPLKIISKHDIELNAGQNSKHLKYHFEKLGSILRNILFPFTKEEWDLMISTSPIVSKRMASAYEVDSAKVKITGFPRNDLLLNIRSGESEGVKILKKRYGVQRLILYAPTFRNQLEDNEYLFHDFDMQAFAKCLSNHNAAFLVKMHFVYRDTVMIKDLNGNGAPVHWLTEEEVPDLNAILRDIDILVTDYSSIYFDYLLLNRPIIFTPFDIDRYLTNDRPLYEKYEEATPGVKCMDWRSVIQAIDRILSRHDDHKGERETALKKYHTYCDGESCSRVYKMAQDLLSDTLS
jgi:CDP-glycerol glycerophosphotransferase (TagB/SpsB family)